MPRYGFIHTKKEIKILILYVASRLPGFVPEDTLMEQVMCDGGFDYFEYSEALAELLDEKFIQKDFEGRYGITKKGIESEKQLGSMLPYSIRMKVERSIIPVVKNLERNALIGADYKMRPDGSFNVHLSLDDGLGNILSMDLMAPTKDSAKKMTENFHHNAEQIYNKILTAVSGEEK